MAQGVRHKLAAIGPEAIIPEGLPHRVCRQVQHALQPQLLRHLVQNLSVSIHAHGALLLAWKNVSIRIVQGNAGLPQIRLQFRPHTFIQIERQPAPGLLVPVANACPHCIMGRIPHFPHLQVQHIPAPSAAGHAHLEDHLIAGAVLAACPQGCQHCP